MKPPPPSPTDAFRPQGASVFPTLEYAVADLGAGASFGNYEAFARCDAESQLLGLWCAADNGWYAGSWVATVTVDGRALEPTTTLFTPVSQRTTLRAGDVSVEREFFLPLDGLDPGRVDPVPQRAAIMLLRLRSGGASAVRVEIDHTITFPAVPSSLFTKNPPESQAAQWVEHRAVDGVVCSTTRGAEREARAFGSSVPWEAWEATERALSARYVIDLPPGDERCLSFVLGFSPEGELSARASLRRNLDGPRRLAGSVEVMGELLATAEVATPDPLINSAVQWSKVNMLRVQHRYRAGPAFTNDPPQDIVVIRDVAWYLLGSDYVTPAFSREMISFVERYGYHDGGKLTEYLHADEVAPARHDYGLNINDDTPLFVWALAHHALTVGGAYDAARVYPLMQRACDWILSQRGEDGLVECGAEGIGLWGICGWRNIIADYTLSGAVTEVNAECVLALRETATIAGLLGRKGKAAAYASAARDLSERMNLTLLSERTGLYLLNRTIDGTRRHDVTGDEIFPVLCGVADADLSGRILKRLTAADLWTSHGARTVPPDDPAFDPDADYQLVGGVWPNLTAWIAYCSSRSNPAFLVGGMRTLARLLEPEKPRAGGNLVPGQFPERLNGTTFASRGMTLSPWMPPTYLWLAIEGLLGIRATPEGLSCTPALPPSWEWSCVRRLPFRGEPVTVLVYRSEIFSTHPLITDLPITIGKEVEVTSAQGTALAFLVGEEVVLFRSRTGESTESMVLRLPDGKKLTVTAGSHAGSPLLVRVPLAGKVPS